MTSPVIHKFTILVIIDFHHKNLTMNNVHNTSSFMFWYLYVIYYHVSHYPDILQLQGRLHIYVECAQYGMSSSSALQPWVGLGLLKQMLPVTSILGIHPPISTTLFPCIFLYPINPSSFRSALSSLTSRVCPQYPFR